MFWTNKITFYIFFLKLVNNFFNLLDIKKLKNNIIDNIIYD